MMIGQANSPKGRGSLMDITSQGMGVVVMVAKDSKNVFTETEGWYLLIWMFEE